MLLRRSCTPICPSERLGVNWLVVETQMGTVVGKGTRAHCVCFL